MKKAGRERVAKRIARAGVCSRRDAERLIAEGRVSVDGKVLQSPAFDVGPESWIVVDGKPLPVAEPTRLFRYHKPRGVLTAARDPEGRPTIYDRLPPDLPRLVPVGRLDIGSEGLLLLTNDGELKRKLELPSTGWTRRYRARVHRLPEPEQLARLLAGITVDGITYGPIQVTVDRSQGDNAWVMVALKEGKNREVRRVMEYIGHPVSRLIRIAYGPFQLGQLPRGEVDEVNPKVVREQMGAAAPKAVRRDPNRRA
ncbi:MAG TPA: pseudouridine synthase [Geminicoccus sp.]|jgi:23S rRNA pseudouridine2605 synthase|uniref:pseudouridine synthase n=1 Tax=Geminicoccus sp. TaxID=2024832 RepID=UPI002E33BA8D|nr:pseudouridine synthase [Geminicoccus sp.]HEX2528737.1 pseudouridine synthase [Geminicoccus sp.]